MGGMPPLRGAADAAGVAAGKPPPREDVAAAAEVVAAGTAAGVPPPREDVAEVVAAPDEDMGGMPPPRGAADAAGVAAGKSPPREDVAAANEVVTAGTAAGVPPPREDVAEVVAAPNESGAAPSEDAVDDHGLEEVIAPTPQRAWRRYPKGIPVNLMPICLAASYRVLMFAWPRELWRSLTFMLDGAPGRIIAATIAGG